MKKARLFLAINLDDEVLMKLSSAIDELKKYFPNARWSKKEAMHLTLKFFGRIPLTDVVNIGEAVKKALKNKNTFRFTTKGIGGFPSLENPRVLWAGVSEGKEIVENLANRISDELMNYNFIPEKRRFIPHITIARFNHRERNNLTLPEDLLNKSLGVTIVDEVLLYSSELTKNGPIYPVVDRWEM